MPAVTEQALSSLGLWEKVKARLGQELFQNEGERAQDDPNMEIFFPSFAPSGPAWNGSQEGVWGARVWLKSVEECTKIIRGLRPEHRSFLWEVLITEALRLVAQDNGQGKRAKCEEFLAESIPRSTRGFKVDESCKVERDGGHRGKGTYTPDIILRHWPESGSVGNLDEPHSELRVEVKSPEPVTPERLVTTKHNESSRLFAESGLREVGVLNFATTESFKGGSDVGVSVVPLTSGGVGLAVRTRTSEEEGKPLHARLPERTREWDYLRFLLRQDDDGRRAQRHTARWPPQHAIRGLVDWTLRDGLTQLQKESMTTSTTPEGVVEEHENFMWTEAPGFPYFLRRPEYAKAFLQIIDKHCTGNIPNKFRAELGKCHKQTGEKDCRTIEEEVRNSQSFYQDACNTQLRAYCAEAFPGTPSIGE
jgi:hypothetical protein